MEDVISKIRQTGSSSTEIVDLEKSLLAYLKLLNTDEHHTVLGYSYRLRRFKLKGSTSEKTYSLLHKNYCTLIQCTNEMKRMMDEARKISEGECEHDWTRDWSDRDERTRYICNKCGKSR